MKDDVENLRKAVRKEMLQITSNASKFFVSRVAHKEDVNELIVKASGNRTTKLRIIKTFPWNARSK